MPENKNGYKIDDSILDKPITVGELLDYLENFDDEISVEEEQENA